MTSRRYKTPNNRNQQRLLPPSLEEYVDAQNPVRAIDVYVNSLDLAVLGFQYSSGMVTRGQPPYAPGDLLKLYLYGYLNKVRSSRSLERESRRNLEVIWLLGELQPSFKTIADFRKNNPKALQETCRSFTLLCKELELFGAETVAIDGSFFQGNASKGSIYTQAKLKKQIEVLDRHVNDYLQALDDNDRHDDECEHDGLFDASVSTENLQALQEKLKQKKAQLQHLQDNGETQLSMTDPDARQLSKRGQCIAGYNVQIAVDEKHKLLVASEVTNDGNDTQQLYPIGHQAKQVLQSDALNVLADTGYWQGEQLHQCEQDNITAYVAVPDKSKQKHCDKLKRFSRNDFEYLVQSNVYRCPAGNTLSPLSDLVQNKGKLYWRYMSKKKECDVCPYQAKCLGAKEHRKTLQRWEHEEVFDRARERANSKEGQEQVRLRSSLAEHPFGTLKRRAGWDHFLVRGFEKVRGEWSLMALCYNFTRVLNIKGLDTFKTQCQRHKIA